MTFVLRAAHCSYGGFRVTRATRGIIRWRAQSASEQNDQNDDHQYQAEAPAIVMKWRANIEATATEKEDENNQ